MLTQLLAAASAPGLLVPLVVAAFLIGAVSAVIATAIQSVRSARLRSRNAGQLRDLLEVASEGILVHCEGEIVEANGPFCRLVGLERQDVLGRSVLQFLQPGTSVPIIRQIMGAEGQSGTVPLGMVAADGRQFSVAASTRPLRHRARSAFAVALRDMTDIRKTEVWAQHLSSHDPLTDLANSALFEKALSGALAMAVHHARPVAVLRFEIDDFRTANEEWGHAAGDRLLQLFAERLRELSEPDYTLARLRGDSFAVLLPRVERIDAAGAAANRFLTGLNKPFHLDGRSITLIVAIGVAVHPTDGETSASLMSNAGTALERARKEGAGRVCFFEQSADMAMRRKVAMRRDLRAAVANRKLELYYQPLMECRGPSIAGYEALLRWKHPVHGAVSPAEFVPLAEEIGLITELGAWVLETACAEAASWDNPAFIAVNLSPAQFLMPDMPGDVARVLARTGLSPDRLELEVTEGLLIADPDRAMASLLALKEQGISIALDDFGTGYSSLSYLQRFPFNRIKIDKSFVKGMGKSAQADAIVDAVMALGRSLHLVVTAEGVETVEQFEALRRRDCEIAQGFLFSPALPAAQIRGMRYDVALCKMVRPEDSKESNYAFA
jgi:diguanylate cyclase (GGDEF)-like protein/PAS domain S-box-containing protein